MVHSQPDLQVPYKAIPLTIPARFLIETDKLILKFRRNLKGAQGVNTILNNVAGLILPNFQTYYNTTVIKTK